MTTAIAQALSTALLHFVWQGLVVALVLWVALFLLRNRSAHSRYLASCLALAVLALLPAITAYIRYEKPVPAQAPALTASTPPAAAVQAKGEVSPQRWLAAWQSWAVPVWSFGVLLFSIRLVWGCLQVSTLRRRGTPPEAPILATISNLAERLAITRRINVLMTAVADGPSVVGWIRPVVLLPSATLLGLTPEQLEAVLAHELAHIRRHDYLVNMVQILLETLLFYHPAVWWISARIRDERELCCDDLAVSSCGDPLCYARALTKLERLRLTAPQLAMAGTGGPLLYRIQRLVGAKTQEYGPSKLPGIVALCLGLACFAINVHWAKAQSQEQPKAGRSAYVVLQWNSPQDDAGVAVDVGSAAILHRSSIEYPRMAVKKGIQGTVTVEATIDAAGDVSDARVLSGPSELRRAALQSVLEWHFSADPAGNGAVRQINISFDSSVAQKQLAEERSQAGAASEAGTYNFLSPDGPKTVQFRNRIPGELNREYATTWVALASEDRVRLAEREQQLTNLRDQLQQLREERGQLSSLERDGATSKSLDAQTAELQAQLAELETMVGRLAERRLTLDEPGTRLRLRDDLGRVNGIELTAEQGQVWVRNQMRETSSASPNFLESGRTEQSEPNSPSEPSFLGRAAGHRLARIDLVGFSDDTRKALVSQLPVHLGDTLSQESIDAVGTAIRKFDEHLAFKFRWTIRNAPVHTMEGIKADGDDWILQVVAPNSSRKWDLIQK